MARTHITYKSVQIVPGLAFTLAVMPEDARTREHSYELPPRKNVIIDNKGRERRIGALRDHGVVGFSIPSLE